MVDTKPTRSHLSSMNRQQTPQVVWCSAQAFAKEDANHDGVVDEEEAAAAHLMTMGIEAAGTVGAV